MNFLTKVLASGLGTGFSPVAPGTAGSALAAAIAWLLRDYWSPAPGLVLTAIVTVIGVAACTRAERFWGHDNGRMVIDVRPVVLRCLRRFRPLRRLWVSHSLKTACPPSELDSCRRTEIHFPGRDKCLQTPRCCCMKSLPYQVLLGLEQKRLEGGFS